MNKKQAVTLLLAGSMLLATSPVFGEDAVYIQQDVPGAIVNGQVVDGGTPINVDGTMYVPLRFLSKIFGKNVYWDNGRVTIGDQPEDVLKDMTNEAYVGEKLGQTELGTDLTDIRKIKDSLKTSVLNPEEDPSAALAKWKEDGSFEGVEYFIADQNTWTASQHLEYVRSMVKAAYSEGNANYGNEELKQKIAKSLEYWATCGRVDSSNWWYKQIGIPNIVVDILLINPDVLTDSVREILNQEAAEGSVFKETITDRITERPVSSTGGNLTDKLVTSFKIAIATENEKELYDVLHLLENELRVFTAVRTDEFGEDAEGIKADYSFHQHVDQVQFGGYGEVFLKGVCTLLESVKGTKYMIADNALNELTNFLLDGMQWAFRNEYRDFTVIGRSISRPDNSKGIQSGVKRAVDALEGLTQIKRYEELMALKTNRLSGEDKFTGNRQFWLSDYMAHKRDGFHVGVKIASDRTKLGEVINDENMLGYYLSDGVTVLMQDGNEYENVFPVWDWNKLPGTTTPQGGLKNLNDWAEWNGEHLWNWKGNNTFVGGVSDGTYGAAVMDYTRDGMDAHKAWFLFDDQMVALGNGINSYTDMDIYTNLNQCVQDGEVKIVKNGSAQNAKTGTQEINQADYVLHDGIGYIFDGKAELTLEERTESWGVINGGYKDKSETKNVFQLGIHHGANPKNAAYQYQTVFNTDEAKMNAYVKNSPITVLRNDDKVQAVYNKDLKVTQAIVWKMDTIEIPGGLKVTTNKKCALIIRELADGTLQITASNPENDPKDLQITVNKTLPADGDKVVANSDGTTLLKFRLNEGIYAGSSTTYRSDKGFDAFQK